MCSETLQLQKGNVDALQKRESLSETKPGVLSVVADAMAVAKELGATYLWVDALCTVHNDELMKADLIKDMDTIYGCAVLMVAAAGSVDPKYPGMTARSGSVRQALEVVEGLPLPPGPPAQNPASIGVLRVEFSRYSRMFRAA